MAKPANTSIYSFSARTLTGEPVSFERYRGRPLLIVNTASECGFTPQYAGLQQLHEQYAARGLEVLGFPCNQFGKQEPGDAQQIGSFCDRNFGVSFQLFEKIDVKGPQAHPLYKYLTKVAPGLLGFERIKWNFTKFLVDRDGNVVKRYAPVTKPEAIVEDIEHLL
ncbi:glutathione peroxidase [Paraburkholderia humisilvae]|uniref:Glutathione peroxidase n=1 Tax=Paraburkholderia humisilvae TaxID=627669 RepID=A0A6J5D0E3_9BURK|nr:glutathione peroxidase [Paraburkholderia humisilvae]CAB3747860.1 Hydroperoxy fatty acid reductase gpx1 [Paraburkholderia humisilvae]